MAEPTIDESRDGARVVVYGDASPVTAQEWHCARLMRELYGLSLVIDVDGPHGVYVGNVETDVAETRSTRADAVWECTETLAADVRDRARAAAESADSHRTQAAWHTERATVMDGHAARLRALLAGAP